MSPATCNVVVIELLHTQEGHPTLREETSWKRDPHLLWVDGMGLLGVGGKAFQNKEIALTKIQRHE